MSNIPRRRMSLHDKNKLGVTRKKQDEILIQVESIHHIQGSDIIAIFGGNSKHLSGNHEVTIYGNKEVFSSELLSLMMGKVVRVKMLIITHTSGAKKIDASELVGNAKEVISIKEPYDFLPE